MGSVPDPKIFSAILYVWFIQQDWLLGNLLSNDQNPLHTFPRNFLVDREVANLLQTC